MSMAIFESIGEISEPSVDHYLVEKDFFSFVRIVSSRRSLQVTYRHKEKAYASLIRRLRWRDRTFDIQGRFEGMRRDQKRFVLIRLAAEGVPIGAICRVYALSDEYVRSVVNNAYGSGTLSSMPADDWPDPDVKKEGNFSPDLRGINPLIAIRIRRALGVTPSQAKMFLALLSFGFVSRVDLAKIGQRENSNSLIKGVDVQVRRIRNQITKHGLRIETVWGEGYQMDLVNRTLATEVIESGTDGGPLVLPTAGETYARESG